MIEPGLGDFFVVRTNGWIASCIRYVTNSTVNHAGVYVGNGKVVEARPGGAGYNDVKNYENALWSTNNLPKDLEPTDEQRQKIVAAAIADIGIPYGFLDIFAIGIAQKRFGSEIDPLKPLKEQPWWVRRILNLKTGICSQLVDKEWNTGGIHLFSNGRLEGLVAPEDLRGLLIDGMQEQSTK